MIMASPRNKERLPVAEDSKGLEADTSQQAEDDLLTLEVVQGTSLVGGAYSGGRESEKTKPGLRES